MKNKEKFTTADERSNAFWEWCSRNSCSDCALKKNEHFSHCHFVCQFYWLEREADVEVKRCPFCGGKCSVHGETYAGVECDNGCGYSAQAFGKGMFAEAVAAHNRVCKAVSNCDEKGEPK